MSTLVYATLTGRREEGRPGTTTRDAPPGVGTWVDAVAALVPAEVLALHGLILPATTKTTDGTTVITEPRTLFWAFVGLIVLSVALYVGYRLLARKWDKLDWVRMFIPPFAFIAWTMLQRATAFDAVLPGLADATRTVVALFLSAILGIVAAALAYKADQKPIA